MDDQNIILIIIIIIILIILIYMFCYNKKERFHDYGYLSSNMLGDNCKNPTAYNNCINTYCSEDPLGFNSCIDACHDQYC